MLAKRALVTTLDRGKQFVVEAVQRLDRVIGDLELALTEDAQDHDDSSGWAAGWAAGVAAGAAAAGAAAVVAPSMAGVAGAAGELTLQRGQLRLDVVGARHAVEFELDVVGARAGRVVQGTRGKQLVDRAGPGLHALGLVFGALYRQADIAHLFGDAREGLADLRLGLGGGVSGLDRLLLRAERVDLGLETLRRERQLLLLGQQLRVLGLEVADLLGERRLAGQRFAGEVFATRGQRRARLAVVLVGLLLQLGRLEFEPLAGRRDVGNATPHLLQQLELLGVAVVKRLARVFSAVKDLVGLGIEDERHALHHTHGCRLLHWRSRRASPPYVSTDRTGRGFPAAS